MRNNRVKKFQRQIKVIKFETLFYLVEFFDDENVFRIIKYFPSVFEAQIELVFSKFL